MTEGGLCAPPKEKVPVSVIFSDDELYDAHNDFMNHHDSHTQYQVPTDIIHNQDFLI